LVFQVVSFLLTFPPNPCTFSSLLPCVPHVTPTSFSLIYLPNNIWMNTKCEAPHCSTFPFTYYFIPLGSKYSFKLYRDQISEILLYLF
jgi:hypothetical protein